MKQSFLENDVLILACLILSVIRIYLEVIKFEFSKLPISKKLPRSKQFHKMGFYFSLGYFVLFAPGFLFY